ncbi:MAG: TFIIB-type zinc ribbon-containing protein, partial [Halanaeroarchaeum sp.]
MTRSTRQRERETTAEQETDEGVRECPECGSENLVKSSDRAELVCDDCGLVVEEEKIDPGPEWRAFNHQERQEKSRVGAPTTQTMHDKGLTTTIDWKD